MRAPPRAVEAIVFALTLLTYTYAYDPDVATNARAHFDQTVAIVEFGTLRMNPLFNPKLGLDAAATGDWSMREERLADGSTAASFYPAKAPGLSFLGVPVYSVARAVERAAGVDPLRSSVFIWNARIVSIALSAIPAALAAVLLARLGLALGAPLGAAVVGALAIALGTCYATFASVLYAHTPTAAMIAAAAYFVFAGEACGRRAAWAGLFAGLAVLTTYQAAAAVPALGLALALRARRAGPVLAFVAGGLPPLAAFALIHWVEFGSPLATAYDFQNPDFTGGKTGSYFATLSPLGPSRVYELLFSPFRGLFFYSPVLVPAVGAAAAGAARGAGDARRAAWVALFLLVAFLVVTGLHPLWWGGFSTGPRLLVPGFVLLAPFAAHAYARWPRTTGALLAVSIANALAATLVSVSTHEAVRNPLRDAIYPALFAGALGRDGARSNLGMAAGLSPRLSLVPLALLAGALALALRRAVMKEEEKRASPPHPLPLPEGEGAPKEDGLRRGGS